MRYIKFLFILCLTVALVSTAMANRAPVTLNVLTDDLANLIGVHWSVTLPLYAVLFGGIVLGLLIGFVWEWLREHKHRSAVTRKEREVSVLKRELTKVKGTQSGQGDDVLALLD